MIDGGGPGDCESLRTRLGHERDDAGVAHPDLLARFRDRKVPRSHQDLAGEDVVAFATQAVTRRDLDGERALLRHASGPFVPGYDSVAPVPLTNDSPRRTAVSAIE